MTDSVANHLRLPIPNARLRQRYLAMLQFSLFALFLGTLLTVSGTRNYGMALAAGSLLMALVLLPVEYGIVAVSLGPLMLTAVRDVDHWYGQGFRWIVILLGAGLFAVRARAARINYPGPKTTGFTLLMRVYVLVALLTIPSSQVPSLTAAKCIPLIAMTVLCEVGSAWLAGEGGPLAARRLVRSWSLFLMPTLSISALLWFRGDGASYSFGRFLGTSANPNSIGAVFAFALPFIICPILHKRLQLTPRNLALAGFATLLLYLLLITHSRASVAGFAIGSVILVVIQLNRPVFQIVLILAITLLPLTLGFFERIADDVEAYVYKQRQDQGILGSRANQWKLSYEKFRANPMLGIGFGVTDYDETNWNLEGTRLRKEEIGSSVLAVLSQVGIVGGIPYFAAIALVLITSLLFAWRVKDPWFSAMVASVWAGMTNALFEGWFVSPGSGLLWLMITQCYLLDALTSRFRPPSKVRSRIEQPDVLPVARYAAQTRIRSVSSNL